MITEEAPGRTVLLNGRNYLFFGGTSYLGMQKDADFARLLAEGLKKYGLTHGSSRVSNLRLAIYDEAERMMADWLGSDACMLLSSGFMAGQLLVNALLSDGWTLHHAPGCHPALIPGDTPDRAETNWDYWTQVLPEKLKSSPGKHVILTCSVDPLYSRRYDLSFVADLKVDGKLLLVVDDSHGLGVLGDRGEGVIADLMRSDNAELLILGSLAKGPGIPAGAIWSRATLDSRLRRSPFFVTASPPAPAGIHAFLKAGHLQTQARERLRQNTGYLAARVQGISRITHAPGLPVFFLDDSQIAGFLFERGILVSSFAYPDAGSASVSRAVLSALHMRADLDMLADALEDYFAD